MMLLIDRPSASLKRYVSSPDHGLKSITRGGSGGALKTGSWRGGIEILIFYYFLP